jgi:Zn-dependent peptidase ImmA (M78 family)
MIPLEVRINRREIEIDKDVFISLLSMSPASQYRDYEVAVTTNTITFPALKRLADKASIPYPLLFAPKSKVSKQIMDQEHELFQKLPSKEEMRLNFRGRVNFAAIALIVQDLARKQEFLKNRLKLLDPPNLFVGLIARAFKLNTTNEVMAKTIREYLSIDLRYLRTLSKGKVLEYLCKQVESKGILVSFSSYNYMPQNIERDAGFSGLCIKDTKYPFIFINTRDADLMPTIFETSGRQIYTLIAMLVCIAMNKFIFSLRAVPENDTFKRHILAIAGEVLIPRVDLEGLGIGTMEQLEHYAKYFSVTPSMLLVRLKQSRQIPKPVADVLRARLIENIKKIELRQTRSPKPSTGYAKYNGDRFSLEVLRGYKAKIVGYDEVKNILFRKGRMSPALFHAYHERFRHAI